MPPEQQQNAPAVMTRETLEREQPALFAQLRQSFRAEGQTVERDRVAAVRALALPGHEAVIERCLADGSSADATASQIVKAQQESLRAASAAHANDAPEPVAGSSVTASTRAGEKTKEQQRDEAKAYQKEHPNVDFIGALKACGYA